MDHKCLQVLLLVNMCMMLCVALPLSYGPPEKPAFLFKKMFLDEERSVPDEWSKGEQDERLRENLLRDMLDWNKRGLGQLKRRLAKNEKRGPGRCNPFAGRCIRPGRDESTEEAETRRELALAKREPGDGQINEMDINKMQEYDIPV